MGEIWILAEARDGELRRVSHELSSAARGLGGRVCAVVIGKGASDLAPALRGVDAAYVIDGPQLGDYSPDGWARVIALLAEERKPAVILGSSSSRGRDLTPRIAAVLGVALASDVVEVTMVDGALQALRPIYAGKALARVRVSTTPMMATLRSNSYPAASGGEGPPFETIDPGVVEGAARVVATEYSAGERPDVAEADIIVSGGRGMGGPEHFHLLETLADTLGAAVGASRAVVDAGWRPHGDQVGQTGKTVSPSLYIACGISGAVQHLAGMKTAKVIVAINKDAEAPIFGVADFGIVGDVFEVVPALSEAIRAHRAG